MAKKFKHTKEHPGFKAIEGKISRNEGISRDEAAAILAKRSEDASAKAKKKNPRLKRVKG